MWYPTTTVAVAAEPITVEDAKLRLRIDFDDDDADIAAMIASVRDHAEKYCNLLFGARTVSVKCDRFSDLARLPVSPVQDVTSVLYVDHAGDEQTLDEDAYELRADGLDAALVLKHGAKWPVTQAGSRITVTADVGYEDIPPAVRYAMLLYISDAYQNRETSAAPAWTAFDSLLCNYRRGA